MKSRTDFVSIGWMDQLRQAMYNQIKAMGALLWVLLGFTVGMGNMMMEISPFGAALCAAAPFRYLPAAALGSAYLIRYGAFADGGDQVRQMAENNILQQTRGDGWAALHAWAEDDTVSRNLLRDRYNPKTSNI